VKLTEIIRRKLTRQKNKDIRVVENHAKHEVWETLSIVQNGKLSEQISLLTPREHDLFLLLLEGFTLKESAKQLSMGYSTANTHMTSIYKKLNVNSRAALIIRYRNAAKGAG